MKYANDLSDIDAHCVLIGTRAAVRVATFFPTIAEIREYAKAEAARFTAQDEFAETRQLNAGNTEVGREESRRLVEKWGPRIREIIDNAKGPLAGDLSKAVSE